jgi:ABC-type Zn uptake system ZnuABC Zn-binding protein ZnuA
MSGKSTKEAGVKRAFISLPLAFLLLLSGCAGNSEPLQSSAKEAGIQVVGGTTLISSIVKEIGGSRVNAESIIPPAENPFNFVVKPENITSLSIANIFLIHDWQQYKFPPSVTDSANNPGLKVVKISLGGDWMIPEIQIQATDKVLEALKSLDARNSAAYDGGAAAYKEKIRKKEAQIKEQLKNQKFYDTIGTINTVCASPVADFVKWLGVSVVAIYGPPDSLTPARIQEIIGGLGEKKIALIADGIQNGENAGAPIAAKLGVDRIILSNYPGAARYTTNWEDTFARNVTLIIATISACPYCQWIYSRTSIRFEMQIGTRQALFPKFFENNGPYFLTPYLNDAAGIEPREFGGSQYIGK